MKVITSLFVIAALSIAASTVRAQDDAASPAPASEETAAPAVETPSTTSESAPVAMPEEKPAAAAIATPSKVVELPASGASASATPSAEKKKTASTATTAPATKPAATKTAAPLADSGSPESNVKRLEGEWETAVMKHDLSYIQNRVAEDFTGCSSKGKRLNKAGLAKEMKNDSDTYTSAKNGSVTVRAYGSNVAIATGTSKEVGKGKDGKAFSRTYAWTDTWMLRGKTWQCIGSQSMLVAGK